MASACSPILATTTSASGKFGSCAQSSWTRKSFPVFVGSRSRKPWMKNTGGRLQYTPRSSLRPISAVHVLHEGISLFEGSKRTNEALAEPRPRQSTDIALDMLESWVYSSVSEIVRHLSEAPYVQHVFKSKDNIREGERQRVSEELFEKPEIWDSVRQCLLESQPDGLILVHRLDPDSLSVHADQYGTKEVSEAGSLLVPGDIRTDVWGVLVQGRNIRCNSCFLLKTTRVSSPIGVLTQFCLSRATCFGPSIKSQLQRMWLL